MDGYKSKQKHKRTNNYAEKLKDPRWQKKRLQILDRDGWTCQICRDTKSPLHVHHLRYFDEEPWDIDDKYLLTLCEKCHIEEPEEFQFYARSLIKKLKELGYNSYDLMKFGSCFENYPPFFEFNEERFDSPQKINNAIREVLSKKE